VSRIPVQDRVFVPKARTLEIGPVERLVQIVLIDVTEEEHRCLTQARERKSFSMALVSTESAPPGSVRHCSRPLATMAKPPGPVHGSPRRAG